jgi:hypothetical protein
MAEVIMQPGTLAGTNDAHHGHGSCTKIGRRVTIYRTPASPNGYIDYSIGGRQYRESLLRTKSMKQAKQLAHHKDAELILGKARGPSRLRTPWMST